MPLLAKTGNFEFYFDCTEVSDPQDRFGVSLDGKLIIEFDINCVGIFPLAEAVQALRPKPNSAKLCVFPGMGVFPLNFSNIYG
jgi:hypothetical protein